MHEPVDAHTSKSTSTLIPLVLSRLGRAIAVGDRILRPRIASLGDRPIVEAAAGRVEDSRVVVGLQRIAVGTLAVDWGHPGCRFCRRGRVRGRRTNSFR